MSFEGFQCDAFQQGAFQCGTPTLTLAIGVHPSRYTSQDFTVACYSSLIQGRKFIGNLDTHLTATQVELQADGGYWTAKLEFAAAPRHIEDWLEGGLNRHIEIYDHAPGLIFEGFVNVVSVQLGNTSLSRGPMLDVENTVALYYQTQSWNTNPPIPSYPAITPTATDDESIALYGTLFAALTGGEMATQEALDTRDSHLAEHAFPAMSQQLSLGSGQVSLQLEVLGYVHWLSKYVYNQVVDAGVINLSDKIARIVAADPNGLFSTDLSGIESNTLQVGEYENQNRHSLDVIKELVARGDATGNRWLFGVGRGRRVYYHPAPQVFEYRHYSQDNAQRVETLYGAAVRPWNVQPGKWILVPDYLVGRPIPLAPRTDPRAVFIESVSVQLPYGLSITGGKADKLGQRLGRQYGIAGAWS